MAERCPLLHCGSQGCCAPGTHWPTVLGPVGLAAAGDGDSDSSRSPSLS